MRPQSQQRFLTSRAVITAVIIASGVQISQGEPAATSSDGKPLANLSRRTPLVELVERVGPSANPRTIQTDAPIESGNSGGPMFNALGELIGIVAQKPAGHIGLAIRVDQMREVFREMMSAEERFGLILGLEADTMGEPAKVTKVAPNSPAQKAGVQAGDEILQVGEFSVCHGLDFHISLNECKVGQPVPLKLRRSKEVVSTTLTPSAFNPVEPVKRDGLRNGLRFSVYRGNWEKLPDFDEIEPVDSGVCSEFTLDVYDEYHTAAEKDKDHFGLRFTGFVDASYEGLYFFCTKSDDGSRLYIGDRLVVDNDGAHASTERSGQIRLKAGLHPITVTYFEADAGEALEVSVERLDIRKQRIPPQALFFKPEDAEPSKTNPGDL